jgi:hypothetical protein
LPPPEETIDDGDIVSNVIVEDSDGEEDVKTEMVAVEVTETLQQVQSVVPQPTAEEPQKKRVVKKKPTGSKLEA